MAKLFIRTTVTMAVVSALLLAALLSWSTLQHYHERTYGSAHPCRHHTLPCSPGQGGAPNIPKPPPAG